MKRLFIFAHFDRDHIIDPHVIHYVSALAQLGVVIFVSTSRLSDAEIGKVRPFAVRALCRPNVGYDFMSWQLGLRLGECCDLYDEVVVCNDSVYAPIFPLSEMFQVMEGSEAPYWGVTSNSEIARHIQSYFIAFRRPVLEREEFWQFWNNVGLQPNKQAIIEEYEVGLSLVLRTLGLFGTTYFSVDEVLNDALINLKCFSVFPLLVVPRKWGEELFDAGKLVTGMYNKTLVLWRELMLARVPIVKVQLLRENPTGQPIDQVLASLERYTTYPVELIQNHLRRTGSPSGQIR
jgi:rhamnosyltransferase